MKIITILMICLMGVGSWAQKPLKEVPKVKKEEVGILDPETREPVNKNEYEILSVKEIDRRFIPTYKPEAEATFKNLEIYNEKGEQVTLPMDRVTLVEYWSKEGNKSNKYWEKIRALEKKYADSTLFRVLSINYDGSFNTPDKIPKIDKYLKKKQLEKPANLYYDLNDTFRDHFHVFGPVIYLLIDNRQQLIHGGRGEFARTQEEVLDQIENALKNMKKDGLIVNEKNK